MLLLEIFTFSVRRIVHNAFDHSTVYFSTIPLQAKIYSKTETCGSPPLGRETWRHGTSVQNTWAGLANTNHWAGLAEPNHWLGWAGQTKPYNYMFVTRPFMFLANGNVCLLKLLAIPVYIFVIRCVPEMFFTFFFLWTRFLYIVFMPSHQENVCLKTECF